jgi:hypothetical protein
LPVFEIGFIIRCPLTEISGAERPTLSLPHPTPPIIKNFSSPQLWTHEMADGQRSTLGMKLHKAVDEKNQLLHEKHDTRSKRGTLSSNAKKVLFTASVFASTCLLLVSLP